MPHIQRKVSKEKWRNIFLRGLLSIPDLLNFFLFFFFFFPGGHSLLITDARFAQIEASIFPNMFGNTRASREINKYGMHIFPYLECFCPTICSEL